MFMNKTCDITHNYSKENDAQDPVPRHRVFS